MLTYESTKVSQNVTNTTQGKAFFAIIVCFCESTLFCVISPDVVHNGLNLSRTMGVDP